MESPFFEGLFLQANLIFALGAQNIFVLESGLKKQNPLIVSISCFLCDFLLLTIGVAVAGSLLTTFLELKIVTGIVGIFFLIQYGVSKIFQTNDALLELTKPSSITLKKSILLSLSFSLLNPHAYLDAFVLIGGYSAKYLLLQDRLAVGAGAALYSFIWFLALTSASSLLKPILSHPGRMRLLSRCCGVGLLTISFQLSFHVYQWITLETASLAQVSATSFKSHHLGRTFAYARER